MKDRCEAQQNIRAAENYTVGLDMAQREKYWKELSIEEKIERLREVVKQRDYKIQELESEVLRLKADFPEHAHQDGKVMTPVSPRQFNLGQVGMAIGARLRKEEEYF